MNGGGLGAVEEKGKRLWDVGVEARLMVLGKCEIKIECGYKMKKNDVYRNKYRHMKFCNDESYLNRVSYLMSQRM